MLSRESASLPRYLRHAGGVPFAVNENCQPYTHRQPLLLYGPEQRKARSEERAEDIKQYGARSAFPRAALSALLRLHNLLGAIGMEFIRQLLDLVAKRIVGWNLVGQLDDCGADHGFA